MQDKKDGTKTAPGGACILENGAAERDDLFLAPSDRETQLAKPHLLLHSCCGPCSTACIERLLGDYDITVYYYNPNIDDPAEYERRKAAQMEFLQKFNAEPGTAGRVSFMEAPYDPERFLAAVKGLEEEPEGGARCGVCFIMRLQKTAETASLLHYDVFGTTLTVSPHKDYATISAIGKRLGAQYGISYLDANFKKKDGFKRSIELSKKYGLYRQNYCGCRFSKWEGCDGAAQRDDK
ncbi:MAG: epoxyqueuosine reductase QueH [Clostridiales bacterium]|nr:epoxyqueuosine reductase QueH [Clostridiales bacterium]